jgi:hypothetical protein
MNRSGSRRRNSKTLCIVSCGRKKIWDRDPTARKVRASEAYIGQFSRKCSEYAKKFYPDSWCYLSAKHGFLFPNEKIPGQYNVSFLKNTQCKSLQKKFILQIREKHLDRYDSIVLLGGKRYFAAIEPLFSSKLTNPLQGLRGIGWMMQAINIAIKNNKPLQLVTARLKS